MWVIKKADVSFFIFYFFKDLVFLFFFFSNYNGLCLKFSQFLKQTFGKERQKALYIMSLFWK